MKFEFTTEEEKKSFIKNLAIIKKEIEGKYAYLDISAEKQNELFEKAVKRFLESKNTSNIDQIISKFKNYYNKEYTLLIKNILATDFDNKKLEKYTDNFLLNKDGIEDLVDFADNLKEVYPNISFESCLYLVENNSTIKNILNKELYQNNKLNDNKLNSLLETNLDLLLVPFCQNNNIEIDSYYDDDQNVDNYHSTDAIKDLLISFPTKVLTAEEERECLIKIKAGDKKAKDYFITHNLRLVFYVAKKYVGNGTPLIDIFQDGCLGLIKAIDRMDINKGIKFSTYATWWIRQSIMRSLDNNNKSIRLPVNVGTKIRQIMRMKNKMKIELGYEPSDEEVAKELGFSQEEVKNMLSHVDNITSYNIKVSQEDDDELQDFIPDTKTNVEETVVNEELSNSLRRIIAKLPEREQMIISLRYGLDTDVPWTLEKIGKKLNITRERVRQIEAKALKKIYKDVGMKEQYEHLYINSNKEQKPIKLETISLAKKTAISYKNILEASKYLEEEELLYLKKIYGPELNNRVYITDDLELSRIVTKLNMLSRAIIKPEIVTYTKESLSKILSINNSDELYSLINSLDKNDKQVVFSKYNNDPTKDTTMILPAPLEHYFNKIILNKLRNSGKVNSKYKYFKTNNTNNTTNTTNNPNDKILPLEKNCSEFIYPRYIKEALNYLSEDEKKELNEKYKMVKKRIIRIEDIKKYQDPVLDNLLSIAINIRDTGKYNLDINNCKFTDIVKLDPNELEYLVELLKNDYYPLLKERFGQNFIKKIEVSDISLLNNELIIKHAIPKLYSLDAHLRRNLENELKENSDYTSKALSYFSKKDQTLIKKLYALDKKKNIILEKQDYARLDEKILPLFKTCYNEIKASNAPNINTVQKIANISNKLKKIPIDSLTLEKIVDTLPLDDQKIISEKKRGILPTDQYQKYNALANHINYIYKKRSKALVGKSNPLYEVLYDKKTNICQALELFNANDRKLLRAKYLLSKDTEVIDNLSRNEIIHLQNEVVPVFRNVLASINKNLPMAPSSVKYLKATTQKRKTILDQDQFHKIEKFLCEEEINIICKKHPELKGGNAEKLTPSEEKEYQKILQKIRLLHKKISKPYTMEELFNCKEEKFKNIYSNLTLEEQQLIDKKFIKIADNKYIVNNLMDEDSAKYKILRKKILNGINCDSKKKNKFILTEDDVALLRKIFTEEEVNIINKYYMTNKNTRKLTLEDKEKIKNIRNRLYLLKKRMKNDLLSFEEVFNCNKDIYMKVYSELSTKEKLILDKKYMIIDDKILKNKLSSEDSKEFIKLRKKLFYHINNYKNNEPVRKGRKTSITKEFFAQIAPLLTEEELNIIYRKRPEISPIPVKNTEFTPYEEEVYKHLMHRIYNLRYHTKKAKTREEINAYIDEQQLENISHIYENLSEEEKALLSDEDKYILDNNLYQNNAQMLNNKDFLKALKNFLSIIKGNNKDSQKVYLKK